MPVNSLKACFCTVVLNLLVYIAFTEMDGFPYFLSTLGLKVSEARSFMIMAETLPLVYAWLNTLAKLNRMLLLAKDFPKVIPGPVYTVVERKLWL